MEITKEWEECIESIYKLINLEYIARLNLVIPSQLFNQYKKEYQEEANKSLSYYHIKLTAFNYCSGPEISETIKIKFGIVRKINYEKKEIIIEFDYANQVILYLIHMIQPSELNITTKDLTEQKDIFSPPISTLD